MSKVKIRIDNLNEMFEIYIDDDCVFNGNYWDFDRPEDIIKLIKRLGHDVTIEDYKYE